MKRTYVVCVIYLLAATFILAQSNPPSITGPSTKAATANASEPDPKAQAKVLDSYGKLPLTFEPNQGQTDAQVKFLSRTSAYTLFLTQDEAVLTLPAKKQPPRSKLNKSPVETRLAASPASATEKVLRMKLRHANPSAKITGEDELPGTSNYFIGNDPKKWRTSVPTYAKVRYEQIYSGIDLVYYGNQRQLEYDFIVAPGANPSRIAFDIRGASQIRRNPQGDLVIRIGMTSKPGEAEIRWHKPLVYQEKNGTRQEIAASYSITSTNRVGFEVAKYDASRPLYIDPLIYSTYLGGSGMEGYDGYGGIAVDGVGSVYVTGITASANFPTTPGAFQTTLGDGASSFVTKFNPTGSALIYSTYLNDGFTFGIAVDASGDAYVAGYTFSTNFPTTPNAFQTTYGGGTVTGFVTEFNPTGSALVYSTYLGGSVFDEALGIAIDSSGDAYVTGLTKSTDFPITPDAFQTNCGGSGTSCENWPDAFVTKLNPGGSALVYSTFLGGNQSDQGFAIAVDTAGNSYVTGVTYSLDFPVTPGAFQTNCSDCISYGNAFVSKLNPTGSALSYSTYLGGTYTSVGQGIAVDGAGSAYVTGATLVFNFPTKNPLQPKYGGGYSDAFVTQFNSAGSALVYSTFLGGKEADWGYGIAVDSLGNAYVTGQTYSGKFPVTQGALQTACNHGRGCSTYGDAFVSKISPSGTILVYSTYLGGSAADAGYGIAVGSADNAYVTGSTESTDFPVTPGAFQTICNGGTNCARDGDAFVAKLQMSAATATTLTSAPNPSNYGENVTFTATVNSEIGQPPYGETVSFMRGKTVLGTGTLTGGTAAFTTSTLKVGTTTVTAVYAGDSNFAASTSKPLKQVVEKAAE